jgi:type I restriction enzyme, S subunit
MSATRQKFKIKEIGREFGDAPFGTALKTKDYVDQGIPVIQGRNIKNGVFEWNKAIYVSEEKFQTLKRSHCRDGDLVFPKVGTIGIAAIAPKVEGHSVFLLSTNMMKMSVDETKAEIRYVYYYFQQTHVRDLIRANAGGSSQPIFNFTSLKNFDIELPPLPTQRRIASILSTYDDLIENNTRRIAILEEMARRLYDEWFVQFRFPGHEGVPMVDSEIGKVPEGWAVAPFVTIAEVMSGGTPKKSEPNFWCGVIPFYTPKDAPTAVYVLETENYITEAGLAKCNSKLYPKDTVFITARGTVGKIAMASEDMAMNQSCYALQPCEGFGPLFLYLATLDAVRELRARSHGAVFDTIIVDTFRQLKIIVPDPEFAQQFERSVRPLFNLVLNLQCKNTNLRTQRDLLLPKLISGEIDVSEVGEPTEEVAA